MDTFYNSRQLPCCELTVINESDHHRNRHLNYVVDLIGAKEPNNYLRLTISPESMNNNYRILYGIWKVSELPTPPWLFAIIYLIVIYVPYRYDILEVNKVGIPDRWVLSHKTALHTVWLARTTLFLRIINGTCIITWTNLQTVF